MLDRFLILIFLILTKVLPVLGNIIPKINIRQIKFSYYSQNKINAKTVKIKLNNDIIIQKATEMM